jgi:hypothetical protein
MAAKIVGKEVAPQVFSNATPSDSIAARQARENVAENVPRLISSVMLVSASALIRDVKLACFKNMYEINRLDRIRKVS